MIKLSDNRTSLMNLTMTIEALDRIDMLIAEYSESKAGPAYVNFEYVDPSNQPRVQITRPIMVEALKAQRAELANYLATLGIEA